MKLAQGLPIYTDPHDLNSYVYSPGLEYVTYAVLAPFGRGLDVRFCRLVNVVIGFAAAFTAATLASRLSTALGGRPRRREATIVFLVATFIVFANVTAAVPHPDNLHTRRKRVAARRLLEKDAREGDRVVGALAQRRDTDHGDGEPLEKVLPELAQLHRRLDVPASRRDDVHVDRAGGARPDAPHRLLLDDLQELRLQRQRGRSRRERWFPRRRSRTSPVGPPSRR